jgi:hypothetical protein
MIMLSSSIGHEEVITLSVPISCGKSWELLSTTRVSYSCKTGKGKQINEIWSKSSVIDRGPKQILDVKIEDRIVEFIMILLANIERENKDGQESERG